MRALTLWSRKAAALVAAALLASGVGATPAAHAVGVKAPTQDDQVILQLQVKKFRMRNELRGYQTEGGKYAEFEQTTESIAQFLNDQHSDATRQGTVTAASEWANG